MDIHTFRLTLIKMAPPSRIATQDSNEEKKDRLFIFKTETILNIQLHRRFFSFV